MKIDVYTCCKNEIELAPFMIDYWQSLADEVDVYVYDESSTDGTIELFSKYNWIHVVDYKFDKGLNDNEHMKLKNSCWKQSIGKADFVMVCDFDETIVSTNTYLLHKELQYMKDNGFSILIPLSFSLISDNFPKYKYGFFLHELCEYGFNDYQWETKPILFDPNKIEEYNSCLGGHYALPKGDVKWYISNYLFLVHCKFIGFDYYSKRIHNRVMSDWNMQNNLTGEKIEDKNEQLNYLISRFNECKKYRFKWKDIYEYFNFFYKIKVDWSYWGINIKQ